MVAVTFSRLTLITYLVLTFVTVSPSFAQDFGSTVTPWSAAPFDKGNPILALGTLSCSPEPQDPDPDPGIMASNTSRSHWESVRIRHAFSYGEIDDAYADPGIEVVLSHGVKLQNELFETRQFTQEFMPVYASAAKSSPSISYDSLADIVTGKITDWSELGASPGPIHIYMNGDHLQKRRLDNLMGAHGIPSNSFSPSIHYARNYDDLNAVASQDENALVVGLLTSQSSSMVPVALDGISPRAFNDSYAMTIPTYISIRKNSDSSDELDYILHSMQMKATAADAAFDWNLLD